MKNIIFTLLLIFLTIITYGQVNYCDSIEISITSQTATSVSFGSNVPSLNIPGSISYDWTLTDESGTIINSSVATNTIFSLPNPMNSDTNYICLTNILSNPVLTIACNICDTVVWNGTGWMLLSMIPPPCNLTGGSVYIDHTSSPWMMNATVNGMSQYSYMWSNGGSANQTQFYTEWCVTITDIITGCDTIICQGCIPDSSALCACPMIYMPVCGCDGNMYPNYCVADCAGVSWTPAVSNGMPGGFLPCSLTVSSCEVEIDGDSIICNWGNPQILEASPSASSNPFISYLWYSNSVPGASSTTPVLTIVSPGTYCVVATDSTGCVDSACFTVSVQDIPIYSSPSPPNICLGDSIFIWLNPILPINNIIWVPTGNTTSSIIDFPTVSTTYVVEALDANGCDRRGEILVNVDSCLTCVDSSLINLTVLCAAVWDPVCGCDGNTYSNDCEALNWYGITSWTQGPCSLNPPPCTVEINNGTVDIEICDGDTAILEATTGFDTYVWTSTGPSLGTSHILNVTNSGIYIVVATDIVNSCVDIDSIEVIVYPSTPLNPMTAPSPPSVCVGDSVVIEVNQGFVNYWWNTGNPLDQGEDRVVIYPTQDFTYVVEALDSNGCESREEILVLVDTCATGINSEMFSKINIYPNPISDKLYIDFPQNEVFTISIISMEGKLILQEIEISNSIVIDSKKLTAGSYILRIENNKGTFNRIVILE